MKGTTRMVDVGRCGGGSVQVQAVLNPETAAKVRAFADRERRSQSNAIAVLLEKALAEPNTAAGWDQAEVR